MTSRSEWIDNVSKVMEKVSIRMIDSRSRACELYVRAECVGMAEMLPELEYFLTELIGIEVKVDDMTIGDWMQGRINDKIINSMAMAKEHPIENRAVLLSLSDDTMDFGGGGYIVEFADLKGIDLSEATKDVLGVAQHLAGEEMDHMGVSRWLPFEIEGRSLLARLIDVEKFINFNINSSAMTAREEDVSHMKKVHENLILNGSLMFEDKPISIQTENGLFIRSWVKVK